MRFLRDTASAVCYDAVIAFVSGICSLGKKFWGLVLQRYKGSRKLKLLSDDPIETEFLLGGHRYGCQYDFEDQAGIDAFSASI
jgi:hypothetical protein